MRGRHLVRWIGTTVVGGWLLHQLHVLAPADVAGHVLVSFVGAVLLLASVRVLRRLSAAVRRVTPGSFSSGVADLEAQLRGILATKVGIVRTRRGGRVVIDFYSDEELDRIYAIITRGAAGGSTPIHGDGAALPDTDADARAEQEARR